MTGPEESVSIGEAYRQLWEVVKLPAVRRFAVVLVTFRCSSLEHSTMKTVQQIILVCKGGPVNVTS